MARNLISKLSLEDEMTSATTSEPITDVVDNVSEAEIDTSNTGDDSELNEAEAIEENLVAKVEDLQTVSNNPNATEADKQAAINYATEALNYAHNRLGMDQTKIHISHENAFSNAVDKIKEIFKTIIELIKKTIKAIKNKVIEWVDKYKHLTSLFMRDIKNIEKNIPNSTELTINEENLMLLESWFDLADRVPDDSHQSLKYVRLTLMEQYKEFNKSCEEIIRYLEDSSLIKFIEDPTIENANIVTERVLRKLAQPFMVKYTPTYNSDAVMKAIENERGLNNDEHYSGIGFYYIQNIGRKANQWVLSVSYAITDKIDYSDAMFELLGAQRYYMYRTYKAHLVTIPSRSTDSHMEVKSHTVSKDYVQSYLTQLVSLGKDVSLLNKRSETISKNFNNIYDKIDKALNKVNPDSISDADKKIIDTYTAIRLLLKIAYNKYNITFEQSALIMSGILVRGRFLTSRLNKSV